MCDVIAHGMIKELAPIRMEEMKSGLTPMPFTSGIQQGSTLTKVLADQGSPMIKMSTIHTLGHAVPHETVESKER